MVVRSNRYLDLRPFIIVDLACDLDKGVVDSDIGCLVSCLSAGVGCLSCLGISLEDLGVVKLLL